VDYVFSFYSIDVSVSTFCFICGIQDFMILVITCVHFREPRKCVEFCKCSAVAVGNFQLWAQTCFCSVYCNRF